MIPTYLYMHLYNYAHTHTYTCIYIKIIFENIKIEIEITKKAKNQGLNWPASIPTCELKHLKLSHDI